jgi:hypothetical protein
MHSDPCWAQRKFFFRAARRTIANDNQGIFRMESNHPDAKQQNQDAAMLSHHATVEATT